MKAILRSIIALSLAGTLFTSCKKECDMTPAIIVNAGPDQNLIPGGTATLTGTVTSGQSPTLVYSWTELSGPNFPAITNSNATIANVSGLIVGTYVFQFQAENSEGTLIGLDTMSIVVSTHTLIIQPTDNLYEGDINLYGPTQWITDDQIYAEAWTDGGAPFVARACLKFDYSGLPVGAVIDSAILYLYSDPNPINGDKINAQSGPANACYIQRITSNWVLPTPFTWNSPPAVTTTDEATIPQSTASNSDATTDVTALVNDMVATTNDGFFIVLQSEVTYNTRQWASSSATDPTIHPKLIIKYH
jgi:hypothetical protein